MTPVTDVSPASRGPLSVRWLLAFITLAALLGGIGSNALYWMGSRGMSPQQRISIIEASDSVQSLQIKAVTDLTGMLIAMRCLDPDPDQQALVRRAQVPCARVLRERGILP